MLEPVHNGSFLLIWESSRRILTSVLESLAIFLAELRKVLYLLGDITFVLEFNFHLF
jgi:hypothetical protein